MIITLRHIGSLRNLVTMSIPIQRDLRQTSAYQQSHYAECEHESYRSTSLTLGLIRVEYVVALSSGYKSVRDRNHQIVDTKICDSQIRENITRVYVNGNITGYFQNIYYVTDITHDFMILCNRQQSSNKPTIALLTNGVDCTFMNLKCITFQKISPMVYLVFDIKTSNLGVRTYYLESGRLSETTILISNEDPWSRSCFIKYARYNEAGDRIIIVKQHFEYDDSDDDGASVESDDDLDDLGTWKYTVDIYQFEPARPDDEDYESNFVFIESFEDLTRANVKDDYSIEIETSSGNTRHILI